MSSIRKEYPGRVEWTNEQGKLHRLDGPAVEWNDGDKLWYLNGKRHREDGPAFESNCNYRRWYLNGEHYSEQDYIKELIKFKFKRIENL